MTGYRLTYSIQVIEDAGGRILNEEEVREQVEHIINRHKPGSEKFKLKENKE